MDALNLAIEAAGGVGSLAKLLSVRQNVVSNWRLRGQVPADRVLDVEAATGVSRHDLRPDIFGPAPEGGPLARRSAAGPGATAAVDDSMAEVGRRKRAA